LLPATGAIATREHARPWIEENHLGRRNPSDYERANLVRFDSQLPPGDAPRGFKVQGRRYQSRMNTVLILNPARSIEGIVT
jgi:hypothetical protein